MRKMLHIFCLSGVIACFGSTIEGHAAAAQASDPDMRCVILGEFYLTIDKDAGRKLMASAVSLYFLGRVDARLSPSELRSKYVSEAKGLQGRNTGSLMNDCVQQLQLHERAMLAVKQQAGPLLAKKKVVPGR